MNFNLKIGKKQKEKAPVLMKLLEQVLANSFRRGKNIVRNFYFYDVAFLGVFIESFKLAKKSVNSTWSKPLFGNWKCATVGGDFRKLLSEGGTGPSQ